MPRKSSRTAQKQYREHPAKRCRVFDQEFKSLLEGYWATVFEFFQWKWAYEPRMVGGWEPDFTLDRYNGGKIWVEVKPNVDQWFDRKMPVWKKMENAEDINKDKDLLLFAYAKPDISMRKPYLGWLAHWNTVFPNEPDRWIWYDVRAWYEELDDVWGIYSDDQPIEWLLDPNAYVPEFVSSPE